MRMQEFEYFEKVARQRKLPVARPATAAHPYDELKNQINQVKKDMVQKKKPRYFDDDLPQRPLTARDFFKPNLDSDDESSSSDDDS